MLKKDVLRNNNDFSKVFNKGKSTASKTMVVFFIKNELKYNRIAFIASKKVGNSVKRNKARRLMKEAFRENKDQLKKGYDIIFIARNNIIEAKYDDLRKSIKYMLKKVKLFEGEAIWEHLWYY